jgi:hypothetical protein
MRSGRISSSFVPVTQACLVMNEISEESIRALMAKWGSKGGQSRSPRKVAASAKNLRDYHANRKAQQTATPEQQPTLPRVK